MSLTFTNEKSIQLLTLFLNRDFSSIDYISNQLGVSNRSVSNYINQLNNDLEGLAVIKNKRGSGYYLSVLNRKKFEAIIQTNSLPAHEHDSLQKRIAFIISKLMNESDKNTLDELAYEMNIGRSTLVNDLKKAAVVLESYNLKVFGKQNSGMYIAGDEISLRFFIIENVYEYLYKESPIDQDIEEAIVKVAKKYDFEANTTKRLIYSVVIMLDRFLNNYTISKIDEKFERLIGTQEYNIALEIKEAIEMALPIELPENEVLFIAIPIAGRRTPTRNSSVTNIVISPEIKELLNSIVERIAFEMNIVLDSGGFSKDLEYHMTFMINRLIFDIHIRNPLINEVKEKYPLAYKMAEIAGDVIFKNLNLRPSVDELGYLAFYFSIYLSEHDVKVKDFNQVAIVCGTGRGTAKLIEIQLRKVLGNQPILDLYSEEDATKEQLMKYDLIFTTIPLMFPISVPVIKINEIFDENHIANQIDNVIYLQKYNSSSAASHHSFISALLENDKFFILKNNQTYIDSVLNMAISLVDKGLVDEGFPERLLKREEKSSMVFDRYIAIPHTVNYGSDQIVLSVGVFSEEIQKEDKQVRIIFMLALPEKTDYDAGLLVKIYDEIIKIASDEKLVHKLSDCKTFEEFIISLEKK